MPTTTASDWVEQGTIRSNVNIGNISADYTLDYTDDVLIVDATSGDVTLTLPSAVNSSGKSFCFKKIDNSGNKIIITPQTDETIDGQDLLVLQNAYDVYWIVSNGAVWYIVGL